MTYDERVREIFEELRTPRPEGGVGIELATIRRGYLSSPVRAILTCRATQPFTLTFRLVTRSMRNGLNLVDLGPDCLEELRDAVDDAIRRRDAIRTELGALADDADDDAGESTADDPNTDHAPVCFPGASSAAPSSRAALSTAHEDGPILFEDMDP
jgi:hypothetical protein